MRAAIVLASLFCVGAAQAAEPIRIGITTVLSGPAYDRGQSEQYGAQLALDQINNAGGVLGRPVEAYYGDNDCKPPMGIAVTKKMIEQQHVSVVIGALCTPVTHAIMPLMAQEKVPLIIATSAGQDFVDASGVGGNDYAFKTIPSELDIVRGLFRYLGTKNLKSVAVVGDVGGFFEANTTAMAKVAADAGMKVTDQETIAKGTTDFGPVVAKVEAGAPDEILMMLGPSTAGFFKAYEAAGHKIPIAGRININAALNAVSPEFRAAGGLADITSAGVFDVTQDMPGVKDFVSEYVAHYNLVPTQRSFFVYEAVYLVADAMKRAGSDEPAAIEQALKTSTMPSRLGGTYAFDDHNHPHLPILVTGLKDGKPAIVATE